MVGLGGLLGTPEVGDIVAVLRYARRPCGGRRRRPDSHGGALATRRRRSARAVRARARCCRSGAPLETPWTPRSPTRPRCATRWGARSRSTGAEQAWLADAIADPGPAGTLFAHRIRAHHRARAGTGRAAGSARAAAARTRRRRRTHHRHRGRGAGPPPPGARGRDASISTRSPTWSPATRRDPEAAARRVARLPVRRRIGRGRAGPGRGGGRAGPRPGAHRARREGSRVGGRRGAARRWRGVPRPQDRRHLARCPRRTARRRCAATGPARRGPAVSRCSTSTTSATAPNSSDAVDAHKKALARRRLDEERRLFYVALTRTERVLLVSAHHWAETGDKPKGPSELLLELRHSIDADSSLRHRRPLGADPAGRCEPAHRGTRTGAVAGRSARRTPRRASTRERPRSGRRSPVPEIELDRETRRVGRRRRRPARRTRRGTRAGRCTCRPSFR